MGLDPTETPSPGQGVDPRPPPPLSKGLPVCWLLMPVNAFMISRQKSALNVQDFGHSAPVTTNCCQLNAIFLSGVDKWCLLLAHCYRYWPGTGTGGGTSPRFWYATPPPPRPPTHHPKSPHLDPPPTDPPPNRPSLNPPPMTPPPPPPPPGGPSAHFYWGGGGGGRVQKRGDGPHVGTGQLAPAHCDIFMSGTASGR